MSAPRTLAGIVAALRAEIPPDHLRTHSLFHLRAALRIAREFGTIEAAPDLDEDPADPKAAFLFGVRVVEDRRVPLGVVAGMVRERATPELAGSIRAAWTGAVAPDHAGTARGFMDRAAVIAT
ncbi:hypothetical protein [Roseovarius sp. C03]|uniref:hypothetical protein n=1 Tax=Roseovarius sp. C03 TaxID=3449222 RepID=UPI003EDBD88D